MAVAVALLALTLPVFLSIDSLLEGHGRIVDPDNPERFDYATAVLLTALTDVLLNAVRALVIAALVFAVLGGATFIYKVRRPIPTVDSQRLQEAVSLLSNAALQAETWETKRTEIEEATAELREVLGATEEQRRAIAKHSGSSWSNRLTIASLIITGVLSVVLYVLAERF